jgi:hypothetical protein
MLLQGASTQLWALNTTTHLLFMSFDFVGPLCLDAGPLLWSNPCSQAPASGMAMCDPTLSFQERVSDLVGNLTLEEKIGLFLNGAQPVARLNIPVYQWWSEGLHGAWSRGGGGLAVTCTCVRE